MGPFNVILSVYLKIIYKYLWHHGQIDQGDTKLLHVWLGISEFAENHENEEEEEEKEPLSKMSDQDRYNMENVLKGTKSNVTSSTMPV
jgi:DNA-binding ferritin-like protein (Dps family)